MDILILNWKDVRNPDVGGAEIILFEFAKRMIAEHHRVTWFTRSFSGCKRYENIDGISVVRMGGKLSVYVQAFLYYKSLKKKPDKVLDCINTICWQTPLYVPKDKRVAYVNQLAEVVLLYELPPPLSHIAYVLEPLQYQTYKNTDFICYSKSVKEDIVRFGMQESHVSLFPMGLDHARYTQGWKSKQPLFVFAARLVKMKRADVCIRAMKHVTSVYPSAKLAVVGYGPQEYQLSQLILSLGLLDNVRIINKNNLYFQKDAGDMKTKMFQEAWALLLPSVKEGWGMVVTEAASCGTPSIVSNVSGLKDSVLRNKTGIILSKYPDEKELGDAMIGLIRNAKKRKQMGILAKKWSNGFTWEKSYNKFLSLLRG
ncbi:glycosyltransferase family 4 protein [Candidatus Gottesmanbacteria bacterium]|nr:glycosyltransferase family 4 protein [Candidatus Gottesmanbacteria bacterium]